MADATAAGLLAYCRTREASNRAAALALLDRSAGRRNLLDPGLNAAELSAAKKAAARADQWGAWGDALERLLAAATPAGADAP